MNTARIFISGNSQAVRLPKAYRFDTDQVAIFKRGDEVVLKAIPKNATSIYDCLTALSGEISLERRDDVPQTRETF